MFIAYLIFIVRRARQDRTPPRSMWTWGRSAMTGQTIFLSKCLLLVLKRHASVNTRVRGFQGASGGKRFSSQPASDGVGKGEHTRIKFFFFLLLGRVDQSKGDIWDFCRKKMDAIHFPSNELNVKSICGVDDVSSHSQVTQVHLWSTTSSPSLLVCTYEGSGHAACSQIRH